MRDKEPVAVRRPTTHTNMPQLSRRRSIYLVAITLGFPLLVLAWWSYQESDPFQRYAHPLQALYLIWAFVVLWREKVAVRSVERATYWTLSFLWVGNYAFGLYSGQAFEVGWAQFVTTVMLNFFVLSVLSHLMFATPTALRINMAMSATCLLVGMGRLLPEALGGVHHDELTSLVQFVIALVVVMSFLYALARTKDDHFEAELEARALGKEAFEDALTGLPNRRRLTAELDRLVEISQRFHRPLSVISFDLDHFKSINDTHGHPVGDEVLVRVAARVRAHGRQSDTVGRWGGEEFLILAPETEGRQAEILAERLRAKIETAAYPQGLHVTASFGVVTREPGMTSDDVLREVDRRLYVAKRGGRNRVAFTAATADAP